MSFSFQCLYQFSPVIILSLAFLLDLIFGDPRYRFHPIRLIGRLIELNYRLALRIPIKKKILGLFILLGVLSFSEFVYFFCIYLLGNASLLLDIYLSYSFIAIKDMADHLFPIAKSLEEGKIDDARRFLSKIVGRITDSLDQEAIIRASVESAAESFVDGILSPVFWFSFGAIWGYPVAFMMAYKVINTLDSMLGYKSEQLKDIGWASAKADDLVNFVPARLSLIFLYIGAVICKLDAKNGLLIAYRDRLKHSSPNSGHPEAFVAGALGIRLGGPTKYPYGLVKKPWIGDENRRPHLLDIMRSIQLIETGAFILILFALFFLLLIIISH